MQVDDLHPSPRPPDWGRGQTCAKAQVSSGRQHSLLLASKHAVKEREGQLPWLSVRIWIAAKTLVEFGGYAGPRFV
jgi:hypothetical protein